MWEFLCLFYFYQKINYFFITASMAQKFFSSSELTTIYNSSQGFPLKKVTAAWFKKYVFHSSVIAMYF